MHRTIRSLLFLLATLAVGACSVTESPVTPRLANGEMSTYLRVKATDSMMVPTNISWPDTAQVLVRTTALSSDVTVSAVIGTEGGELTIPGAGVVLKVPSGALTANTTISMTAVAGSAVAYTFQPHGLAFAKPVKLEQTLAGTAAGTTPGLLANAHAAYFEGSLDSNFVDLGRTKVKVKENQLTYHDVKAGKLKFSVGHFSGYLVACGLVDESAQASW